MPIFRVEFTAKQIPDTRPICDQTYPERDRNAPISAALRIVAKDERAARAKFMREFQANDPWMGREPKITSVARR